MKHNLRISHNSDMLSAEDATALSRDISEGFTYPTPDLSLKRDKFIHFIEDVSREVGTLETYRYNKGKNTIFEKYIGEHVKIYTTGSSIDSYSTVVCKSETVAEKVYNIFLRYSEDNDDVSVYMNSYFMNDGRLDCNSQEMKPEDLNEISNMYYPYIDTDIMFEQFFTGAENILLLVGEPGLGKSKMSTLALKHAYHNPTILPYDKMEEVQALDNQYITCVYVKSTDVLVNDKFWRELAKQKADFCIIDDLDYMLTRRDAEVQGIDDVNKNLFLNQFLSYTDGIEKHRTKFIITTNQKYDDIDSALLREGRLFDILEFRHLTKDEGLNIWKSNNLDESEYHNIFVDDKVYPARLGSEINKRLNKRIKTATKKYLLEDGISKVKKAGNSKKIKL